MQIWHMESYPCGDQRLPHHVFPPKHITFDQLQQFAGVIHYKIDLDDTNAMKKRLSRLKAERNVGNSDLFTFNDSLTDLEEKLEEMYEPVSKDVEVISMVIEGACYYDVEYEDEEWLRIHLERGDLIVIPAGVNHRFTTTPKNYVQIQRFFPKKADNQG